MDHDASTIGKKFVNQTKQVPVSKAKPTEIISSLFSSNPTIPTLPSTRFQLQAASNVPLTQHSFSSLNIHDDLITHLAKMSIHQPTKIQTLSIPHILSNSRDIILQSETGSGKTLAYLLPIIQNILTDTSIPNDRTQAGTCAIILTPTRELAYQVYETCQKLLTFSSSTFKHWLVAGMITGGDKRQTEKARLRKGVSILVATPGRLVDHLKNSTSFKIDGCRWLVLDEADRLMDLGFDDAIKDIKRLLSEKRKKRRTILCSATMGKKVEALAGESLHDPIVVNVQEEMIMATPKQLKQSYVVVPTKLRLVTLVALLKMLFPENVEGNKKVVVFASCCDTVDFIHALFTRIRVAVDSVDVEEEADTAETVIEGVLGEVRGTSPLIPSIPIFRIHGSLTQPQRQACYRSFSSSKSSILLCTDVAARGLDLPGVTNIIQYDPPTDMKDYIHRIGRTARIGQSGESALFLLPSELDYIPILQSTLTDAQALEARTYDQICRYGFGYKSFEETATRIQSSFERFVLNKDMHELAQKAFHAHIRAYATHGLNVKHIFHLKKLHLGHVAKSFALRDAPGHARVHVKKQKRGSEEVVKRLVNRATGNEEYNFGNDGYGSKRKKV